MATKEEIIKKMREPEIYDKVIDYVERNIQDAFNICCRKNLSINEKWPDKIFGGQLNQKTVLITVRMFDLWETAVVDVLSKYFKNFEGIDILPKNDAVGDLTILKEGKEIMRWEIKTSQGESSFTGATHSDMKCENFILINYKINKDKKLHIDNNRNLIEEIAIFVWDKADTNWQGKPTDNNSFTTLKISNEIFSSRKEIIVRGNLEPRQKWCKFIREKLQ